MEIVYVFWAYLPESWLHAMGITYYPSRYWAIAIPCYVMMTVLFVCILYMSLNFLATPPLWSRDTLWDDHTKEGVNLPTVDPSDEEECPIIHPYSDIPIIEVNALLLA